MNAENSGRQGGRQQKRRSNGFLIALRHDTSGNALAIMAAFLLPLTALAGSAVDMSRAYLVRVRLQQACDAGVLAGRKLMTVNTGSALDNAGTDPTKPAETQARAFFTNNFRPGWMSTTNVSFTPTRTSDGQVAATATARMPMALMGMFGASDLTQTVTCTARLDVGDSDIMFVLDTTGSMACVNGSGCSTITTYTREDGTQGYYRVELANSKISSLRAAVATFYTTLAANAPPTANIRYGFVPYASSVNVGKIIRDKDPTYLVDSWTYQSREFATGGSVTGGLPSDVTNGSSSNEVTNNITSSSCDDLVGRTPASGYTTSGRADVRTRTSWSRTSGSGSSAQGTCTIKRQPVKVRWTYKPVTYNTAAFKNSLGLGVAAVPDPSKITNDTSKWTGCIEERETTTSTSFSQSSLPADLHPDLVPNSDATRWKPMWPDVVYYRGNTSDATNSGSSTSPYGDTTNDDAGNSYTSVAESFNAQANYYACGKAAQRLQTMTLAQVNSYLSGSGSSDFRALGYTYHDFGMIWGLRLISPTGIWADDTAAWPGNNPPNRYIVFMSDGLLQTNNNSYGTYGIEKLDQRVSGGSSSVDARHNARFQAVCSAAKAKNITVFVVAFDTALSSDMEDCASPGFAYTASDSAGLNSAFANMALQVAKLRLSQ